MKCGVIGLPNVGKSTLFNAITQAGAEAANYPFCTIEPNTGVAAVPDRRVGALATMFHPKKTTYALVEFVDIAGLVKGASRGEGLGNKFLSHIREVDALVHVVRCFEDSNVLHMDGSVDPVRDAGVVALELILADLETVSKRLERAKKTARPGDAKAAAEIALAARAIVHLESEKPLRTLSMTEDELVVAKGWFMLTDKPVLYAANIAESDVGKPEDALPYVKELRALAANEGAELMVISARVESEIAVMDAEEKVMFLEELGIGESGLDRFAKASYKLLGLISFLTAGADECRAWTIKRGAKAPQAAGKIHTDFERGFIRAEVVPFDTLMREGSMNTCREKGLIRSEGKDYEMKDGDVTLFRFNV
ncbi:MAG: redox-regulated ATPase YchF [Oscillospiraceae bacterium]|jgi:GTP-binding protein YchF|nr:redox-regulated ATPase YchF [Oscillospiraceae bacterium]